ncbi:hypothetical protein G6F70_006462 [Rhizopus microsporus]|nr:hypothetical protein G6F71_008491 [Rhizopus microsporus]KAG1197632.1 hypothetical protein G6F70_006462 [Rhizopus microsporus]KAG1209400.1 hypothetical protein G6F69_006393 [Rhizopus microsporus]KAG1230945.1 hypothetical protein G6F67_006112 [Rhizopus microsporus]KAG1263186.1 hypothetical protein G6F68_005334 [Rhizopus microsporus]
MTKVYTIGVGGPSCSGKTTITRILKRILKNVTVIYQDDFYKPDKEIPIDKETQLANWDCPEAIEFDRLLDVLSFAKKNKGKLPDGYDSKEELNVHDGSNQLDDQTAIKLQEMLSYLSVPTLGLREQRQGYHTAEGYWIDPPGYFDKIVWPEYLRLSQHDRSLKDIVIIDTDKNSIARTALKVADELCKHLL